MPEKKRNGAGGKPKTVLNEHLLEEEILKHLDGDVNRAKNHAIRILKFALKHEFRQVHAQLARDAAATEQAESETETETETKGESNNNNNNNNSKKESKDKSIPVAKVHDEFKMEMVEGLPKLLKAKLADWKLFSTKVVHISESSDYVTTKILIRLHDGNEIEAVILRHDSRTTLCISSQSGGCKMGCTFCATGVLGKRGKVNNLDRAEIIEQVIHANRILKHSKEPRLVTNIVFMGMGEPLNNYKNVVKACKDLTDQSKFSLSPSKITVSTVGVVNHMKTLYDDVPGISLALSLHAPNQKLRQEIIPTAGAYPIPKLLEALNVYLEKTKAGYVMIEYILLSGVNDMPEIARELGVLLTPLKDKVKVNLIKYNPIFNAEGLAKTFVPPTEEDALRFKHIVQDEFDIFCTIRTEMGQDINSACGQLACISEDARKTTVDIEDLYATRKVNNMYNEDGVNLKKRKVTAKLLAKEREEARIKRNKLLVVSGLVGLCVLGLVVAFNRKK